MSCKPKDIKIPVNDNTGLHEVWNNSPVYILRDIDGHDTLADIKLGQTISSTKWLVAVDKRLTLKQLLPALRKLFKKRRNVSMHSNGKGQLYFTFMDSVQHKVSFVEATDLDLVPDIYTSQKYFEQYPLADKKFEKIHLCIYPDKIVLNDSIKFEPEISKQQLLNRIQSFEKPMDTVFKQVYLNFSTRTNFDRFLNYYTFFKNNLLTKTHISPKIFIFTP